MTDGKTQQVDIQTNAPAMYTVKNADGATVSTGTAPTQVTLKRGDAPYTVTLQRTDASPKATGTVNDNLNGWLWGDLFCGIIVCGGVDLATGSAWDLDKTVRVDTMADPSNPNANALNTMHVTGGTTSPITINNSQVNDG